MDMLTDSKQVFNGVIKGRKTTEKRVMLDILATRGAYRRFEFCCIGFVRGEQNPADTLSTLVGNEMLNRLVKTRIENTLVLQWIYRSYMQTSTIATVEERKQ